jgi:hypothetical protein
MLLVVLYGMIKFPEKKLPLFKRIVITQKRLEGFNFDFYKLSRSK